MNIQHNKNLDIALGNSRKTKVWKNRPMQWSELLDRMSKTVRTSETVAEYKAMTRDQQSERKDQGGFVGGYCNNGSRSDVQFRSVLCLDADFADNDLWSDWCMFYGNAGAVYSTHKHTPDKPRLRLVVPLSRNVTPDEYQAIGRRVADTLGIDKFDDTSYQPQRVMYWPSTSIDGQFVFEYLDAPILNPDEVLNTYHNWRDVSSWPMSSRVAQIVKTSATKQKDPLEKSGIVGAFCRAYYPIQTAIEEFIPKYIPSDEQGRYTYTEGSTAAGVIIYDDKFTYSHHATDPASGVLCNAWELVRLHHFIELDANIDPDAPMASRPSYKAMLKMATEDKKVSAQIVADRVEEAVGDFAEQIEANGTDWKQQLKITEKGALAQTIENAVVILRNDPNLKDCLAYNEMDHNIVTLKSLPWRKVRGESQWIDSDDAALRFYLERTYGMQGKDRIFDAVNVVAQERAFHPVRDYLSSNKWDGVKRVDTLLIDYLGAEDTPYTRAVTRKSLVAAVARVFNPGCKFDYMLTIRGRQGLGKSALIAKLGGKWFSDTFTTIQGKDAYEQVQGVWIMEIGELAGMRKAEAETIKLYISKQSDRFRPAYGRRQQEFPRQCIFIGTTNETHFLRDATGNRRFWVVDTPNQPTRDMWNELTPEIVQQIWVEAVELYRAGEPLFLEDNLEDTARDIQKCYEEENPRAGVVTKYLDKLLPENWNDMDTYTRREWLESSSDQGTVIRTTVCTMEIWAEALGGNPERIDRYSVKDINEMMSRLTDWEHQGNAKMNTLYGRQRYYKRRDAE